MAEKGWGRGSEGLNGWSQGPQSHGSSRPSSTWLAPASVPPCHARLSSETCRSHLLWGPSFGNAPVSTPLCTWDPSQPWVQSGWRTITEGLATPTPVPQTLRTFNIYPGLQSQAMGRRDLTPVLRLTEVTGLCRSGNTIWLFSALLVSSSGALVLPPRSPGPASLFFQISLMFSLLC